MTRHWILILTATCATTLAGSQSPQQPPPQIFRAATDVVFVDAFVRSGGNLVSGLTAADFVLEDNEVKQKIDSVEVTAVPIDLTLVIDESGEPSGSWNPKLDAAKRTAALDQELHRAAAILRPTDRIRLLAMDTYTTEVVSLRPPSEIPALQHVVMGGRASVYDSLITALLQPVEPSRRHVVVARTKGVDNMSTSTVQAVRAAADRSDALLFLVMMEAAFDEAQDLHGFQCANIGLCRPTRLFWQPVGTRNSMGPAPAHILTSAGQTLAESAEVTGGRLRRTEMLSEPSLVGTFQEAFDAFRQSYVLRYSPQGVKREGWHDIKVTVPSQPKAQIRARRGYAFDPPRPPAPIPGTTARAGVTLPIPSTAVELTDAYAQGAYGVVELALRQPSRIAGFIRDFRALGNVWPDRPQREAVLAIELAEAAMFSGREDARLEAVGLLTDENLLVQDQFDPEEFERYFLWAELSLLQGAARPQQAAPFVAHALTRFPDEARFVFARAVIEDQLWPVGTAYGTATPSTARLSDGTPVRIAPNQMNGSPSADQANRLINLYEAAGRLDGTAAESRMRLGLFHHRMGRDTEAIEKLTELAGDANADVYVKYMRQLILGRTLTSAGKIEDADRAFSAALQIWPGAQSARVGLMNNALIAGNKDEARRLAELVQTAPQESGDPWWTYWQGDYRYYKSLISHLRTLVK